MPSPVSPIILGGSLSLRVLGRVEESKQTEWILLLFLELNRTGPTGSGPAICAAKFFVRHKAFVGPETKKKKLYSSTLIEESSKSTISMKDN